MSGKRTIKEIVEYLRKCPTNTIVDRLVKLAADNLADKLEDALRIEESKHREEVKSLQTTIKKLNDALTEQNGKLGNNAAIRKALNVADETANELLSWCANHYQELNCMGSRLKRALESAANGPWRNCDRFGGDYKMLYTAWFDWTGSPSGLNADGTVKLTFAKWLLAPATKQKGENDGNE